MMTSNEMAVPVRALARAWETLARHKAPAAQGRLKMFLECDAAFEAWIRFELDDFVSFVDDCRDADVRVRVTPVAAHGRIRHYQVDFVGTGRFENIEAATRLHLPDLRTARLSRVAPLDVELPRRRMVSGPRHDVPAVI
jgi:hypothetical protein